MTKDQEDPIEKIVREALEMKVVSFHHPDPVTGLDFYLHDYGVYIECKAYHTDRSVEQLSRRQNIILIQGKEAAEAFAELISPPIQGMQET